jgi:hypothetical protein
MAQINLENLVLIKVSAGAPASLQLELYLLELFLQRIRLLFGRAFTPLQPLNLLTACAQLSTQQLDGLFGFDQLYIRFEI